MSSKKLIQIITEGPSSYETPDTFNEHLQNPENIPITISLDDRKDGDPGTMHYSDTCEILLFEKITGSVFIAGRTHKIDPHSVFIIPPGMVHATRIPKGSDRVYVFKFSPSELEKYVNLKHIFSWRHDVFDNQPHKLHVFTQAVPHILKMANTSNTLIENIFYVLEFFNVLNKAIKTNISIDSELGTNNVLKNLIDWTSANYCRKININEVASVANFSKSHFCKFFKQNAGITYIEYVNQLRIQLAINMLKQGKTSTECCFSCGFESVSYFTRLFKKTTGHSTGYYKHLSDKS